MYASYKPHALLENCLPRRCDCSIRAKVMALCTEYLQPQAKLKIRSNDAQWKSHDVGVLARAPLRGLLVIKQSENFDWDQHAVVSSIEQNRCFGDRCYHVQRLFCYCIPYGANETPCEQWFSALKYLYHPVQGTTTATLNRRLRARIAGVRGSSVDEQFV